MADISTISAIPEWELRHRLARAMEHGGYTTAGMARALRCSEGTVRNYLSGRTAPSDDRLLRWSALCRVSYNWLAKNDPEGQPPDPGVEALQAWLRTMTGDADDKGLCYRPAEFVAAAA